MISDNLGRTVGVCGRESGRGVEEGEAALDNFVVGTISPAPRIDLSLFDCLE